MLEAGEVIPGIVPARTLTANHHAEATIRILNLSDKSSILKARTVLSKLNEVALDPKMDLSEGEEAEHTKEMLSRLNQTVPQLIQQELKSTVQRYSPIFSKDKFDLGTAEGFQHHINTGSAKPFRQTLRRHPDKYLPIIYQQVDLMIQQETVEVSKGPYASNIPRVKKKDNSVHACLDLRQLNQRFLKELSYKIEHRNGTLHSSADGLTRMKCKQCGIEANPERHVNRTVKKITAKVPETEITNETISGADGPCSPVNSEILGRGRTRRNIIPPARYRD